MGEKQETAGDKATGTGNAIIDTWKYPLTNLGHRGNQNRGPKTPIAIVRDAEGCVLMTFPGEPYRTNAEAIAKASEFCAAMNELHERAGNATTTGNAAAMREALAGIRHELDDYCNGRTLLARMTEDPPDYTCLRDSLLAIERIVDSALSAPPRNCDVGTANEQAERFHAFCDGHSSGIGGMCDGNCPCIEDVDGCHCLCRWSQLPYGKGGDNE